MFWSLLMEHAAFKILPLTVSVGVVERPAMPNDPGRPILKPSAPLQVLPRFPTAETACALPTSSLHHTSSFCLPRHIFLGYCCCLYLPRTSNGATATVYHDVCSVEMNCIPTAHRAPTRARFTTTTIIESSNLIVTSITQVVLAPNPSRVHT